MIVYNGIIITPFEVLKNMAIIINGDIISSLQPLTAELIKKISQSNEEIVDAKNGYIMPGFIDIHTHGGVGSRFINSLQEEINNILRFQASHGITSVLATISTAPVDLILKSLGILRNYISSQENGVAGSRIIGIHLEGPFLSAVNKGAQSGNYLLRPDINPYDFIINNADIVKIVTLSPELPGILEMIKELTKTGIVVSGGHDNAIDIEISKAIEAGMKHATHIYCAMSRITKRDGRRYTGMCEASLTDDRLSAEMIADNRHLPPVLVKLIYKCKGPDKLCIVSDSISAAGLTVDEVGRLSNKTGDNECAGIIIEDGVAMLSDRSVYAGSIQTLDNMIKNIVTDAGIPFQDAIRMATYSPAKVISAENFIGSITLGKQADICIMDNEFNVTNTVIKGKLQFIRKK